MTDKAAIAFLREVRDVRLYSGITVKDYGVEGERYEEELLKQLAQTILHQMARHEYLRSAKLNLNVEMRCVEEVDPYSGNKVLRAHLIVRDKT